MLLLSNLRVITSLKYEYIIISLLSNLKVIISLSGNFGEVKKVVVVDD